NQNVTLDNSLFRRVYRFLCEVSLSFSRLCCVKEQSTSSVIPQAVTCPLMPYRLVDSWNYRRILFWILAPILREFTITQQGRFSR
ncbi:hypothetical protein, partial [Vibrio anguillarum]|uniref:hypothetical protein n=2 Tax=Vibrio anguillarum TaxID=55601 RepID=UPI001BE3DA48